MGRVSLRVARLAAGRQPENSGMRANGKPWLVSPVHVPSGLLIVVPVFAVTVVISQGYLRASDRLVSYMKEFHGAAWARLNGRFLMFPGWGGNVYRRPRKARVIEEMVWCWRMPLRHPELQKMIIRVRWLGVLVALSIAASIVAFAMVDPRR